MVARRPPLVWLHTLLGERLVPLHDLKGLEVEDRISDQESLTYLVRADDRKVLFIVADQLVEHDGRYYRTEEVRQLRDGPAAFTEVYCEARWMDLGKRSKAGSFSVLGQTAEDGLAEILIGTGWTGTVTPAVGGLFSMEDLDATVLSLLRRWAQIVGREIQWNTATKTVDFVPALGQDLGIGFRWGHNLKNVERRYRPPLATRLYPIGANDLDISGVEPVGALYVEDFSWYLAQGLSLPEARGEFRKDVIWVDSRYLLALNLYDAALRRIAYLAQPQISYELSVADFSELTGSTADDVEIGDTVRVRDATFEIDVATRCVRLLRRPLSPETNQIELAYLQPGLAEIELETQGGRSIDYGQTNFLVDDNAADLTVTGVATPFAEITVTSTGEATFIAGGTFKGTASGTGTVRFSFAVDGVDEVPTYDFAFTDGVQVEFSWPTFATGVDGESSPVLSWRARVISGSGTIAVAADAGRGWVLAKGAVGVGVNSSPNQQIEETLALVTHGVTDAAIVEMLEPFDLTEGETVAVELVAVDDDDVGVPPDITIT